MKNLLLKTGLRNVIGLTVEASESTEDCGQFCVLIFCGFLGLVWENQPIVHSWGVGWRTLAVGRGDRWRVALKMWHMTCDRWHVTHEKNIRRKLPFPPRAKLVNTCKLLYVKSSLTELCSSYTVISGLLEIFMDSNIWSPLIRQSLTPVKVGGTGQGWMTNENVRGSEYAWQFCKIGRIYVKYKNIYRIIEIGAIMKVNKISDHKWLVSFLPLPLIYVMADGSWFQNCIVA